MEFQVCIRSKHGYIIEFKQFKDVEENNMIDYVSYWTSKPLNKDGVIVEISRWKDGIRV